MVETQGDGIVASDLLGILGRELEKQFEVKHSFAHFHFMVRSLASVIQANRYMSNLCDDPERERYEKSAVRHLRGLKDYVSLLEKNEAVRTAEFNPAFADGGYVRFLRPKLCRNWVEGSYSLSVVEALKKV